MLALFSKMPSGKGSDFNLKNLNRLRDPYLRRTVPSLKELSEIALNYDLISAALIRVSKITFDLNEMHKLVGYVHDKFKELPEDFNF